MARSRLHPMRWPRWCWYAAAVLLSAALSGLLGWLYWAVHDNHFWTVFLVGTLAGSLSQGIQLWRQDRRRNTKEN